MVTQQHDVESKSRRLTEKTRPASAGTVRELRQRVDELQNRLTTLEQTVEELVEAQREPPQHSEW